MYRNTPPSKHPKNHLALLGRTLEHTPHTSTGCARHARSMENLVMKEEENGHGEHESPVGVSQVLRSLTLSTALFLGFVSFAVLLYHLSCGFWCDMLLGSA